MFSNGIVEYKKRYDDGTGSCKPTNGKTCSHTIAFDITETMSEPVFVYYDMKNFFQNHRRYMISKVTNQLQGEDIPSGDIANLEELCVAVLYNYDGIGDGYLKSYQGKDLV